MKLKKAFLWSIGGLFSVCLLMGVALFVFFPAEKLRLLLQERASAELERPVSIGSVRVSIWGGLGALFSDITVGDPKNPRDDSFSASVEAVDIKVQFWPLLSGDYVIDRLIIERPDIRIRASRGESGASESRTHVSQADVSGVKVALGGLSFGKLEIRDGSLKRYDVRSRSTITVEGLGFSGNLTDSTAMNLYESAGTLEFESIMFRDEQGALPIRIPSASIAYLASFNSARQRLSLEQAKVTIGSGQFSISGEIPLPGAKASAANLKTVGALPLALLKDALPTSKSTSYGGELDFDLAITGPLAELEGIALEGRLAIADGSMSSPGLAEQLEKISAEFLIHPKRIEIRTLALQFSESDLALNGTISNPFPYLLPVSQRIRERSVGPFLEFSLTSKRLNIDGLFPEASPGSGVNRADNPAESTAPIFLPEIKGRGTVDIDTLIYAEIAFANVNSKVRLERRRMYCDDARSQALGGQVDGNVQIDLTDMKRPGYSGRYAARELNVQEFVDRFAPWDGSGLLTGEMSAGGSYAASGWRKEDFIAGLTMDILSQADSLRLTSAALSVALTSAIQLVSGKVMQKDEYEALDLHSFKSQLRFVDGALQVDTLRGISDALGQWSLHGAVDLTGGLALSGILIPTETIVSAMTPRNAIAGALAGLLRTSPEGAISIPFKISGSTEKPVFDIDNDALSKALNKTLKERGGSILKGLFEKP